MFALGQERKLRLGSPTVSCSAKGAAGDLVDYFRYGFVTGHRPGNLTQRQLISYAAGPDPEEAFKAF